MYSLLNACNIVRKMDSSAGRMNVFMSVLRNSRKIRYSYTLYRYSPNALKAVWIVLYGLKCYLSLAWGRDGRRSLIFFASYPSERQVLNHVRNNLPSIQHGEVTISLQNIIRIGAFVELLTFIPASIRLYLYAQRLVLRYPFMPACRVISTATYYMRFKRLLSGDSIKAVFIACHYSPECLGLAAAAHRAGKKVLFTNHANATGETGYVPPVHADLVAVTSQALADLYQRHSPHQLNIIYLPMAIPQHPMQVPESDGVDLVVGIYLTALTNEKRLQHVVADLNRLPTVATVFIRTHPAQVVNADLSKLTDCGRSIEISNDRPLGEDIGRTDIAVCGNSTVTIELLRGGRPVLYDHRLDQITYDYNGYVQHGLILNYPDQFDADIVDRIRQYFAGDDWIEKMRYFDCGYQRDEATMMAEFQAAVVRILRCASAA